MSITTICSFTQRDMGQLIVLQNYFLYRFCNFQQGNLYILITGNSTKKEISYPFLLTSFGLHDICDDPKFKHYSLFCSYWFIQKKLLDLWEWILQSRYDVGHRNIFRRLVRDHIFIIKGRFCK